MHPKPDPFSETSNAKFFEEIQTLSKALNSTTQPRRHSLPSNPKPEKPKPNKNLWKTLKNPLKTLSHLRQSRFSCTFSLQVHSIQNLPHSLSNATFVVHWKRASDNGSGLKTRPVKAVNGSVDFSQEVLKHQCSVYGSKGKYESREFLVYVNLAGATGYDYGKNRVEMTRMLPDVVEELNGEKNEGRWSTSFGLVGKARGAVLNVSFGYAIDVGEDATRKSGKFRRRESVKGVGFSGHDKFRNVDDLKIEMLEETNELPESKRFTAVERVRGNECEESEFMVVDKGVEIELKKSIDEVMLENVRIDEVVDQEEKLGLESYGIMVHDLEALEPLRVEFEENGSNCKENIEHEVVNQQKDSSFATHSKQILELDDLESSKLELEEIISSFEENVEFEAVNMQKDVDFATHNGPVIDLESPRIDFEKIRSNYKARGILSKSLSLDDLTENIASEFLSMLGLENNCNSDLESPREQLLKQFEKEGLTTNDGIFDVDGSYNFSDAFDLSSMVNKAEIEHHKSRAKMLEDEESEALMREWGLNEKVFESSMPNDSSGFGSPINFLTDETIELPPLDENLDSFIQTKDGGFLRSMSPSLFKASKNSGSLVMQASSPIVIPAEMGSDIMEILQSLASIGIEKLSMQASKLMPLEDITGKTMRQVAWEASSSQELCERSDMLEHHNVGASGKTRNGKGLKRKPSRTSDADSEYVSLEDLAPLAMDKIEALSIEGLRIQSGMSDEVAPSDISSQFIRSNNNTSIGLEGAGGLQLLDVKDNGGDVDGLMGLSLTLDEWMRLDSGDINENDEISEKTTKILEAHHAKSINFLRADKNGGKRSGKKWGLLGNNFTVALMVQLRDPLRNYEPVGTPMLALIQVERVFIPPKPKIFRSVFEKESKEEDGDLVVKDERKIKEVVPQFKITEVHIAGLKTEPSNRRSVWGNSVKPQSGSRWLLANGMGKSNKHPFMKSNSVKKPSQATTKVQSGETLWSISSRVHGDGGKWKELAALNPHIRNPNVIFPNQTIKLC